MSKNPILVFALYLMWNGIPSAHAGQVEGFAEPYRTVDISSVAEPSVIKEIHVRAGNVVKKDDLLAELDTALLDASLAIAKRRSELVGKLRAAQADIDVRKTRFEKLTVLRVRGHATQAELDRAESELAIADANLVLAVEELELYKLECQRIESQIAMHSIRSPIDGVVVQVYSEPGETTSMTNPVLMTLVQLNPLRAKFSVSVPQARELKEGQPLKVHLPEIGADAPAQVEVIAPVLDARSGTVQVTCVIDNNNHLYRSGMRCLLQVPGDAPTPPVSPPASPPNSNSAQNNDSSTDATDDPFGF